MEVKLNCCQCNINENDKIVRKMIGPLRNKKFLNEYCSDEMVHRNITMLSGIGAVGCSSSRIMNSSIRLELNRNGTTLIQSLSIRSRSTGTTMRS